MRRAAPRAPPEHRRRAPARPRGPRARTGWRAAESAETIASRPAAWGGAERSRGRRGGVGWRGRGRGAARRRGGGAEGAVGEGGGAGRRGGRGRRGRRRWAARSAQRRGGGAGRRGGRGRRGGGAGRRGGRRPAWQRSLSPPCAAQVEVEPAATAVPASARGVVERLGHRRRGQCRRPLDDRREERRAGRGSGGPWSPLRRRCSGRRSRAAARGPGGRGRRR